MLWGVEYTNCQFIQYPKSRRYNSQSNNLDFYTKWFVYFGLVWPLKWKCIQNDFFALWNRKTVQIRFLEKYYCLDLENCTQFVAKRAILASFWGWWRGHSRSQSHWFFTWSEVGNTNKFDLKSGLQIFAKKDNRSLQWI